MTTIPMHPVDAAWFHMDGPANTAVVTALLTTRRRFDPARVKSVLARRLAPLPAFRRRVADDATWTGMPAWAEDAEVDIDQHVHHRALPAGADGRDLRALVEDLASQPLSPTLPLWQADVIDGPGASGALVFRYHHCLGDGAAMMAIARQVLDDDTAAAAAAPAPVAPTGATSAPLLGMVQAAVGGVGAILRDLARPDDPPSALKGRFTARQHLAWSRPLPLEPLKAVAHRLGATLNDLAVAAIAGALRGYLVESGQFADGATMRAMVPVNLRRPDAPAESANAFGLVMLELPIDRAEPLERLQESIARMSALKRSPEAPAMRELFDLFGRGPKALQQVMQGLLGSKASLVLTNVAGPRHPLHFAGRTIDRLMFWVPHPGEELGLGASVCSYRGRVTFGILADARQVPDPQRIATLIERELDGLRRIAAGRRRAATGHVGPAGHRAAGR